MNYEQMQNDWVELNGVSEGDQLTIGIVPDLKMADHYGWMDIYYESEMGTVGEQVTVVGFEFGGIVARSPEGVEWYYPFFCFRKPPRRKVVDKLL